MTWLSIVTVVRDDQFGLERTMDSVQSNDLDGVEWVVIDSSRDQATVESLVSSSARYEWVAPEGIYPAMNRGIELARGEFVLFLNAGDEFFSPETLQAVRNQLITQPCDWAYGQIEIIEPSGITVVSSSWDYVAEKSHFFARGSFPPHQATLVRLADLRALGGFDTSYRITADYKVFLQLAQMAYPIELPFVLARFPAGGASSRHWRQALREFHRARVEVLAPSGAAALSEAAQSLTHAARVATYRWVLEPARRFARR